MHQLKALFCTNAAGIQPCLCRENVDDMTLMSIQLVLLEVGSSHLYCWCFWFLYFSVLCWISYLPWRLRLCLIELWIKISDRRSSFILQFNNNRNSAFKANRKEWNCRILLTQRLSKDTNLPKSESWFKYQKTIISSNKYIQYRLQGRFYPI